MIKNKIKKHIFVEDETTYGFGVNVPTARLHVTGIDPAYIGQDCIFSINNGRTTTLRVDGNIITNGILHALYSVAYNTETNRLNYWNGNSWVEINL